MNEVDSRAFGSRVAARRQRLQISQAVLAGKLKMQQSGIAMIEAGVVERPRKLRELAQELQTTEEWLLWEIGPEERVPPSESPEVVRVSLLSWVSAGELVDSSSQIGTDDAPSVYLVDLGPGEFFALRVSGDSMDRISPDGSIIVINRSDRNLIDGKFYVFSYRGEATFKRWRTDPARLAPYSTNQFHDPIFIKGKRGIDVIGRVCRTTLDL